MGALKMGMKIYHTTQICAYIGFGFVVGGITVGIAPISIPIIYTYISYENELRKLFKL